MYMRSYKNLTVTLTKYIAEHLYKYWKLSHILSKWMKYIVMSYACFCLLIYFVIYKMGFQVTNVNWYVFTVAIDVHPSIVSGLSSEKKNLPLGYVQYIPYFFKSFLMMCVSCFVNIWRRSRVDLGSACFNISVLTCFVFVNLQIIHSTPLKFQRNAY